jgi:hypothetical protein
MRWAIIQVTDQDAEEMTRIQRALWKKPTDKDQGEYDRLCQSYGTKVVIEILKQEER